MAGIVEIENWFEDKSWKAFDFQKKTWNRFLAGKNGIVNAPTGSGKTYSLLVPIILHYESLSKQQRKGLCAIWITPIRALAKEIVISANRLVEDLDLDFTVGIRSGDTSAKEKAKQKTQLPNLLITTPESLHILIAQKTFSKLFKNTFCLVADEWHELMGSKRGVQVELALSKIKSTTVDFRVWGISATIGNLDQAMEVLLGTDYIKNASLIQSKVKKKITVKSILPNTIEHLSWGGHLGTNLLQCLIPILRKSASTLIFTNTRAQSEIWYKKLIEAAPEFAGIMAVHHGSLSKIVRNWVEDALQSGELKVVICTSSLDLGVDFTPVETIVQIGGPKGVSRFMQRAGRSGHKPGAESVIYFLPTHTMELVEAAALREAIALNFVESREPYMRSFDVLLQFLMTMAVGEGFDPHEAFEQIRSCYSYSSLTLDEWSRILHFLETGGDSLGKYDEFKKTTFEEGLIVSKDRKMIRRHKMSIGTIVSDTMIKIKYKRGGYIGNIEESFMSKLNPGDIFWFAGKSLELVSLKLMTASVVKSTRKASKVPAWQGGTLPISGNLSKMLRLKVDEYLSGSYKDIELKTLAPLFEVQRKRSHIPSKEECLIEYFKTDHGYHLLMYPFEGKSVNEGIASLLADRISRIQRITFSIAFNDYGLELLSDQSFHPELIKEKNLLGSQNLFEDVNSSINATEMARRRFRDIASISGLVFKGFPGQPIKDRHLQGSSDLFFDVFEEYDSGNLLLQQSFEESLTHQMEYDRLRSALHRIEGQNLIITYPDKPTPFGFPIMVDRLRERLSSESLGDRIKKMTLKYS